MSQTFKVKHLSVLVAATTFMLYQLFLLQNSFPAIHRIYTTVATNPTFWNLLWFLSEFTGEIGLIIRFVGSCLFVFVAYTLLRNRELLFSVFRKAVLLEGIHYLFYIPFIVNLFTRPVVTLASQMVYIETAVSYSIQTVLVSVSFILLYVKSRNQSSQTTKFRKWFAIGAVCFVFSLWVKHFMFNLYALPIDLTNPVLVLGLLNSAVTMLASAVILLVTLVPVIKERTTTFNQKAAGFALVLVGVYFIIYILVAQLNGTYMAFLQLTELWAITFAVAGAGYLIEKS